jgi:hypothetical protein
MTSSTSSSARIANNSSVGSERSEIDILFEGVGKREKE